MKFLSIIAFMSFTTLHAYFPSSYEMAKKEFRSKASDLMQTYPNLVHDKYKVDSEIDDNLYMDTLYIPAQSPKKLLLISSGIHGVEAYAGHAMQMLFIKKYLKEVDLKNTALLFIHTMNPYGFKYHRRVSENNIDLNRNFVLKSADFDKRNEGYVNLNDFLNPPRRASKRGFFGASQNYFQIGYYLARYGMNDLRQAILEGQYQFPQGIYFGGKEYEPQVQIIDDIYDKYIKDYQTLLHIDMHTGYGEKGRLHLFGSNELKGNALKTIKTLFEGYKIDFGSDEDFYEVTGDFTVYLYKKATKKQVFLPMTFEYGTLDSQTTLGSIDSLNRMRDENQGHHHHYKGEDDKKHILGKFMDMFNPRDKEWREMVLKQTETIYADLIKRYNKI